MADVIQTTQKDSSPQTSPADSTTINDNEEEMDTECVDANEKDYTKEIEDACDNLLELLYYQEAKQSDIISKKHKKSKKKNEIENRTKSIPDLVHNHQVQQRFLTTNVNLTGGVYQIITGFIFISLAGELDNRTDKNRYTELRDCFGNKLVLILYGCLPKTIDLKISLVSTLSKKDYYYSRFKLFNKVTNEYENIIHCRVNVEDCGNGLYRIILDQLLVQKELKQKEVKPFKLIRYPPPDDNHPSYTYGEIPAKAKNTLKLVKKYKLTQPQLAIGSFSDSSSRLIQMNDIDGNQFILSNVLRGVYGFKKSFHDRFGTLNIKVIIPNDNSICFDGNNLCGIRISVDLPRELCNTSSSGCKWLEISLVNKGILSSIYHIVGSEGKKNLFFIRIEETSFQLEMKLAKQTSIELRQNPDVLQVLYATIPGDQTPMYISHDYNLNPILIASDLNKFQLQCRLIHVEKINDHSSICYDNDVPTWQSTEFTEDLNDEQMTVSYEEEIVDEIEQTSTNSDSNNKRDNSFGLPITRVITQTNENNHHEQSIID